MRELRRKAYNNTTWRKLRDLFLKEHPICQDCVAKGKITPAVDIHHLRSPFKGGEVNYGLLLDYNNLAALCKECHAERHNKEKGFIPPEEILRQLDMLFDENISDKDLEDED